MDLSQYQKLVKTFAVYPDEVALPYLGLGLSSEAGEVAGKLKKVLRGDYPIHDENVRMGVLQELGDVYWYAAQICNELGVEGDTVLKMNIEKLQARKERGAIKGDGDDRT